MNAAEQRPMSQFEKEAHSFVIRIWRESQTVDEGEWRGWIEHAQTRQRHYFHETTEISPIIISYLNGRSPEETVHA